MAHKIGRRDVERAFERYQLLTGDAIAKLWRDEDVWCALVMGADGEPRTLSTLGNERMYHVLSQCADAWQEGRRILLEELGVEKEPSAKGAT